MNTKIIIYPRSEGGVAILYPSYDCGLTLEEIANKDVPKNTPYKIIETSQLPDTEFMGAWEWDYQA